MNALTEKEIFKRIYTIRGKRVMLDRDLSDLYGVPTKRLNEQVKRNADRFPEDFMFQMTTEELENWRSQFATSNSEIMGLRRGPYVFTDYGILMLSSVLKSQRATEVNIQIMRAFVKIKEMIASSKGMMQKIDKMEDKLIKQDKSLNEHSKQIKMIFSAIRQLLPDAEKPVKKIGFRKK